MGRILDFLTGRKEVEKKAIRDELAAQEDLALEQMSNRIDEFSAKRKILQGLVEELRERRRGRNNA